MEQITKLLVDHDQNLVSSPLLTTELESLAPFWAIFETLAHYTSTPTWEKLVILDQI
jgi:hypothetical protein